MGKPVTGKPVTGRPVRGRPVRGKPVTGRPDQCKPVRGKPVRGKPEQGQKTKSISVSAATDTNFLQGTIKKNQRGLFPQAAAILRPMNTALMHKNTIVEPNERKLWR
jgi:hypothetical protein